MTTTRWTGPQETMAPNLVLTTVLVIDGQPQTLHDYLSGLLRTLWRQGAGFDATRPYGNPEWQTLVYRAMAEAQLIDAWWSPEGVLERFNRPVADAIIDHAISVMTCMTWPRPTYLPCVVHTNHKPVPKVSDLHHLWPLAYGGPDTPENTIAVCPTGHRAVHEFLELLVVHKGDVPFKLRRAFATGEKKCAWQGYKAIRQGLT